MQRILSITPAFVIALALLSGTASARNYSTDIDVLDEQELRELEELLGRPVGEWVRRGESSFAEAGLRADSDAGALRAAMVRCPILMERPIALRAGRAVVGRPPEAVRGLF